MVGKQTLRQLFVIVGLILNSFVDGYIFGQMSGMIDALHETKDDIPLNDDDLSWIASTINITCFFGMAIVGTLTDILGRRKAITVINMPVLMSWFMLYFTQSKNVLLASRILVGLSYGGILMLIHISVGEYIQPNLRALYLNVISCIGSLSGTFLGHILSILVYWRNVALIGIAPTILSALLPLFWEESPSWLASKGRFKECERAFKALHVPSKLSENELNLLLNMEKRKNDQLQMNYETGFSYPRKVIAACKQKYFWKTFAIGVAANTYRVASGRILFATLAITMLQDITANSNILLYTLLVDGFALIGAFISCLLLRKFNMRPLLFTSGLFSNSILLLLAFCLYFWPENNNYVAWIKVTLLALYFIGVSAGPYPILETLMTELYPLEIKTFCLFSQSIVCGIIQFLSVKLAPSMFLKIGYHGVFLFHVIIVCFCLSYLYFYLPETKSKTLQQIEISFKKRLRGGDIETNGNNVTELLHDNKISK